MTDADIITIEFAGFRFDFSVNTLSRGDAIVPLEPVSSRVLRYLLENRGRLVPKEEILEAVWPDVFTTDDVLKRAVSQIRRALGDDARNSRFLETHHRRGYRFVAVVTTEDTNAISTYSITTAERSAVTESPEPSFDCFVGRSRELDFLKTEFRNVRNGRGQPVLVVGEPGIGKTQIAANFTKWAAEQSDALPLRVRFFDYEASFLPALDVFLDLLDEARKAVLDGIEGDLQTVIAAELDVELPAELFSADRIGGRQSTDAFRAVAPIAETFVRLSRRRPLILVFDDLQWADRTSRQIIGHLMRISRDEPLMILGLTRRGELKDSQSELAGWLQAQAVYRSFTTLELAALSDSECRALIGEIFGDKFEPAEIPRADLQKLHAATGGNPYFLVETLRLLMNAGVVEMRPENGFWRWNGLRDVPLPETIRMAALAKLAPISPATRELVECAAVLGDTFLIRTLELMTDGSAENAEKTEAALDESIAAQILTEHNVGGADDCQFYHTTIRRAVYLELSPRRRKRLHARALRAIEASHADDLDRFAAALAAHAENAGEFEKSLRLNLRACRAAVARFDWLEAAELMERAERVSKLGGIEDEVEFLAICGEVRMSVGRRTEAENLLMRAAEMEGSASVFLNLGRTRILLGKYREAIEPLEKALKIAVETGDDFCRDAALIQFASAKYALCEYDESCSILQKIIDSHDAGSYHRAVALGKLGWTRALQSRYREAREHLREALGFHKSAGDMRERAVLAMCLSWCEHGSGNYESAIRYALQARSEAQIVGEPYNETVALMRIAKARIAQGFSREVIDELSGVAAHQEQLGAPHAMAETIWMRGRARLETGDLKGAADDLEESLAMIRKIGDRDDEFRILIDLAELRHRHGDHDGSLATSGEAIAIAEEIGVGEGVGEALIVQSRAFLARSDFGAAVSAARESVLRLGETESGELWRACHALALALSASGEGTDEAEESLRSAVAQLDRMREQFSAADEGRYAEFTLIRNPVARDLCRLLDNRGAAVESREIARRWLIE